VPVVSRIIAIITLCLLAAGCGTKSEDPKARQAPGAPPAVDGLEALPGDSWGVIGVDLARLREAPLVARAVNEALSRDPGLAERIARLRTACALEPGENLTRAYIGLGEQPDEVVMAVVGEFDEVALARCVSESVGADGRSLTSSLEAGRSLYHVGGDPARPDVWFALGSPRTLVVARSRERLAAALAGGPKVPDSETLAPLLERADREAGLWGTARMRPGVGEGLVAISGGAIDEPPRAIFGSVRLGDGIDARVGVVTSSAESAKRLKSMAESQLLWGSLVAQRRSLGPLVNRVKVEGEGDTVVLALDLDRDAIDQLVEQIDKAAGSQQNPPVQNPGQVPDGTSPATPDSKKQ
jgi:hypothetical protein